MFKAIPFQYSYVTVYFCLPHSLPLYDFLSLSLSLAHLFISVFHDISFFAQTLNLIKHYIFSSQSFHHRQTLFLLQINRKQTVNNLIIMHSIHHNVTTPAVNSRTKDLVHYHNILANTVMLLKTTIQVSSTRSQAANNVM